MTAPMIRRIDIDSNSSFTTFVAGAAGAQLGAPAHFLEKQ